MKSLIFACIMSALVAVGCSKPVEPTKPSISKEVEVTLLIEEGLKSDGNGATDTAIQKYKKALELDPLNVRAKRRLRDAYSTKGASAAAEDLASQLINQGDNDLESFSVLMSKAVQDKSIATLRKYAASYLKNGGKSRYILQLLTRYYYSPASLETLDAGQKSNIERELALIENNK